MEEWFYEKAGRQEGPVSVDEIRRLLAAHTLNSTSLIWKNGMEKWARLDSTGEFEISPYASPVSTDASVVDWSGYSPSGPQVRPWIRYWARTLDAMVFNLLIGFFIGFVSPAMGFADEYVIGIVGLLCYCFVEPLLLSVWGTTPFKALLLVRVRNGDGSKLTYGQALSRTFRIWVRGLGLGIPLVSLITHLNAYTKLTQNSITSWDADGGFVVSHQTIPWWRAIAVVALVFSVFFVLGLAASIQE